MKKNIFSLCIVVVTLMTVFACSTTIAVENIISISNLTPDPSDIDIDVGPILGTLQWIGYIVAIGMLIWVGIKYVMSGAGEKAKAKETLVPLVFGAVLVAAGTAITAAVFGVFAQ